eukprot:764135-Rhodomonas_salina.1
MEQGWWLSQGPARGIRCLSSAQHTPGVPERRCAAGSAQHTPFQLPARSPQAVGARERTSKAEGGTRKGGGGETRGVEADAGCPLLLPLSSLSLAPCPAVGMGVDGAGAGSI